MQLGRIGDQLESYIPTRYAESWDNVGWMVGPLEEELTGTLLCVDVCRAALDRALEDDLNLILSHHPLIFDPLEQLVDSSPHQRLIMDAVRHRIGIYSVHTNADSMPGGLNDLFADVLGIEDTQPLTALEEEPRAGLGRIGRLEFPRTMEKIESELHSHFQISHLQSLGNPQEKIHRVAVCTGSGSDFIEPGLADEVDLFITGDVGHHKAMEARTLDLSLIIMDHYEMETIFLPFARSLWREQFGDEYPLVTFRRDNPYRHHV